jgi:hypothetical protein
MFRIAESSLRDSLLDETADNLHDHATALIVNDPAKAACGNRPRTAILTKIDNPCSLFPCTFP